MLVNYLIPIWLLDSQLLAWLVLGAAWWLIRCPDIISTIPGEWHTGAFNHPQDGCRWVEAIDIIPNGTESVPFRIVYLVAGFVYHLPYICEEGCPPL